MALAWAAHHWKYCFWEQRSLVTFAYNCAHIVPRNLVNRVVGAHFSFIVLKQRNHEVKLPLARPHCLAMAGRRRAAEPAGVVPNPTPRWQAQKWSDPSRYGGFWISNLRRIQLLSLLIVLGAIHWMNGCALRDVLQYARGKPQLSFRMRKKIVGHHRGGNTYVETIPLSK